MNIAVVGDLLLDHDLAGEATRLSPDAPVPVVDVEKSSYRAGGAGLVARMLAAEGHEVVLVAATSIDAAAGRLRQALEGIRLVDGPSGAPTPVKTRVRASGQAVVRFDEGCARPGIPAVTPAMVREIAAAGAVIVADYGRRLLENEDIRRALEAKAADGIVVWDPHPSGARPVRGLAAATPNLSEALSFAGSQDAAEAAGWLAGSWDCPVVVTLGRHGALLRDARGGGHRVPAPAIRTVDPCGAGDRFVASLAIGLAGGSALHEAVEGAVHAAATFLADGGVAALHRHLPEVTDAPGTQGTDSVSSTGGSSGGGDALEVVERVRAAGGTVVATGGCFDLLHAGHARTLQAARDLGDCLVVLLNSDESVRRLKGVDRPIISARDRTELLAALGCVDAVLLFDEDTPHRALERIRPDIWVKGGDYEARSLPEAGLIASWGGRCVTVPYQVARSTTSLAAALAKVG
ncbi:bifunctional heptose 7-phosphate kinase/heptose 1-phosphate adenyltransferase [Micrococcaceae bacterium RIT802]|nr:bifunctional heptose 7-phosphate kinase/heptose 1-phosphate adenyltransferase [Micrococcaceae bacterium RIT 802]